MRRAQTALRSSLSTLRDEYLALRPVDLDSHPTVAKALLELFALLDDKKAQVTHDHVRTASRLLIEVLPLTNLVFRVAQIRKALDEMSITPALSSEFATMLDGFAKAAPAVQRAAASELQRVRSAASIDARNIELFLGEIVAQTLWAALFVMLLSAIAMVGLAHFCAQALVMFPLAAFFGAFGAWVSIAARVRDAPPLALVRHAEFNRAHTSSVWISPLFGAIGATLVYGSLKAGLFHSPLFSDAQGTTAAGCAAPANEVVFVFSALTSAEQIQMTFVVALLSLAAGWSERLVPDLLEWTRKRSKW